MTAYTTFEHSIASTNSLTKMYTELRKGRKLGPRGRLPAGHEDLLWLPRSAVVAAISSLDAYVHAIMDERVPHALQLDPMPDALCDAMAKILPIKDGKSFRGAFQQISSKDIYQVLTAKLRDTTLAHSSFQMPDKIISAYRYIGYPNIFEPVSKKWPGPATSEDDIKRRLANYVNRRHQIVHKGDFETSGKIRHMQPKYANDCATFVNDLVSRLQAVVYDK